jgi:HAMP domain-containing protein
LVDNREILMRLLAKVNLLFVVLFGLGMGIGLYLSWRFLESNAKEQVLEQARLMMASASATRTYTTEDVAPLLKTHQQHSQSFLAETVPAFAATQTFANLRKTFPDYTYKEATLNPTNPRDRATDWEADVVNLFRNYSDRKEVIGERNTPDGRSMYLAKPLVAKTACLECHSTPAQAPPALLRVYGPNNGFGWKEGEVIGAQVVSVPMNVPLNIANRAFHTLAVVTLGVVLAVVLAFNLALRSLVIRPVMQLSTLADQVSKGDLEIPEAAAKGTDEISDLARAFNRMYVSLKKAMKMLEGGD